MVNRVDLLETGPLPQTDYRPAVFLRMRAQRRIGIDCDRVGNALEQCQVVQRIAVKPAWRNRLKRLPLGSEPLLDAPDFALAETRRASDFAGKFSAGVRRLGRDQVIDAEFACNRRGHETVGRGDDRAYVGVMAIDEFARAG